MTNKRYEVAVLQKFTEEISQSIGGLTFEKSLDEQQDGFLIFGKNKFPLELVKGTLQGHERVMSKESKLASKVGVGGAVNMPNFCDSVINALKVKNERNYSDKNKRILVIECNETANFKEDMENCKPSNDLIKEFLAVYVVYFELDKIKLISYKNLII